MAWELGGNRPSQGQNDKKDWMPDQVRHDRWENRHDRKETPRINLGAKYNTVSD
jgi:hypothetical protein